MGICGADLCRVVVGGNDYFDKGACKRRGNVSKKKNPQKQESKCGKKIENYSQAINIKPSKHLGKGESQADRRAKQANKKQADK